MKNRMFHSWVSARLDLPLLMIINVCIGFSSGISSSLAVYMVSGLSTNPADGSMCTYAYLSGMSVAFPLVQALTNFLHSRKLLCIACILLIFLNFVLSRTDSAPLMILCTFLIGMLRLVGIMIVLISLLPILMPKGERYQLYALYYPVSLIVSNISGAVLVHLADRFNWQFSFHFCNLLLFLVLIIAIILMHPHGKGRKIPLWKFDWFGLLLISICMLSTDYVLGYGQTEDWLKSGPIRLNIILTIILTVVFLYRNAFQKKPLIHFELLRYRNVWLGLLILFLLGAFYSVTGSLNTLMGITFRNNPLESADENLYIVPGYIAGSVLCFLYYRRHTRFRDMIVLCITCYLASNIMIYFAVDQQAGKNEFFLPLFLRGTAVIISYITIGLYVAAQVPAKKFPKVPVLLIFVRSYLATVLWSSMYSNYLYRAQQKMLQRMALWIDSNGSPGTSILYNGNVPDYSTMRTQATMMAVKELYGWLTIAGLILLAFILFFPVYAEMDRRIFNWNKARNARDVAQTVTA